jgi:lysophospholipid acyltransferase (LPLAT)-like uncharacterized protein
MGSALLPDRALRATAALGKGYLRFLGATTRFRVEGKEHFDGGHASGRPVILALWHNRLLGGVIVHRDQRIGVVISQSRDGELISRVVRGFGYVPLRGSSSRGGAQALRGVLRHLRRGDDVALTPDGPLGPRYQVQPGVSYLARHTQRPVVPLGVGASKKWVFRSWDRFQLPLPFGTVLLCYGESLRFGPHDPEDTVNQAIRTSLLRATERADELLGVSSP